ncbi:MAG: M23 family metallopeptidase, partial [Bacteroidales bacterium]|nr:M23 family metallopeptidase [Bacteroidales bacterium]
MACGFCILQAIFAQRLTLPADADYQVPLDIELSLSGNYGELRPNHFHAGLDFKTQSTTGFPVRAFADGYVHRVGINAYGYGLVLYVRHPQLGVTSVYAHLEAFSDSILKQVRLKQVELEANNAN